MNDEKITKVLESAGITDFRLIDAKTGIFVEEWVRLRCIFGCDSYGNNGCCPPAIPPVSECRAMIHGYDKAAILHFPVTFIDDENYKKSRAEYIQKIYNAEHKLFLEGYYKAIALMPDDCYLCDSCVCKSDRSKCLHPDQSRPCAEGMGIDVYKTALTAGYNVKVLQEYGDAINRYAIILID